MQKACWVVILFLVVALGSCLDNDICLRGADNALVIDFKKMSNGEEIDDTVILLNVMAVGVSDTVFYGGIGDDFDTLTSVTLTVNPFTNSTSFTFNDFKGLTKTLEVSYKTEVRFVSEECGSERLQYDLEIVSTTFNDARVVRNSLNKGRSTNIEIFN